MWTERKNKQFSDNALESLNSLLNAHVNMFLSQYDAHFLLPSYGSVQQKHFFKTISFELIVQDVSLKWI